MQHNRAPQDAAPGTPPPDPAAADVAVEEPVADAPVTTEAVAEQAPDAPPAAPQPAAEQDAGPAVDAPATEPAGSGTAAEQAPVAPALVVPAADAEPGGDAAGSPARTRPRGRTALIVAVAALLGVVGGTAVGYRVQADREPTPLAALNQPGLAYPAKPLPEGKEPEPLSAADDRQVRADGDLRKLLLRKPSGARDSRSWWLDDGYVNTASYALDFESEDYMFETLVDTGIRRIAATAWEQGAYRETTIRLVQFNSAPGAIEHAEGQREYMPEKDEYGAGNDGDPLKGSGNGRYYIYKPQYKAGYLPYHRARAVFQRGDVMVDINIFDTRSISKKDIRTLAERQLERM
ncbi:hypothetical protein OHS70_19685 [Streptomyces sp. NBC_00390]|uniref:hypothetical protein n=1 Tax=Streptomyces sp. NBC_00390 TaxID=2975736 RepID=UPI002E1C41DF